MQNSIDHVISLLSWNRSQEEQHLGISLGRKVQCLKPFFQPIVPGASKDTWENCAMIIAEHSDSELEPYIIDMLLWLEDMNWPGAFTISQRLARFRKVDLLAGILNEMIPALNFLNKTSWLLAIAGVTDNGLLFPLLSVRTRCILSEICELYG